MRSTVFILFLLLIMTGIIMLYNLEKSRDISENKNIVDQCNQLSDIGTVDCKSLTQELTAEPTN